MEERPISFRRYDLELLLRGKKTQFRRIAKAPPCPYGQPGDSLWLREMWKPTRSLKDNRHSYIRYEVDGARRVVKHDLQGTYGDHWRPAGERHAVTSGMATYKPVRPRFKANSSTRGHMPISPAAASSAQRNAIVPRNEGQLIIDLADTGKTLIDRNAPKPAKQKALHKLVTSAFELARQHKLIQMIPVVGPSLQALADAHPEFGEKIGDAAVALADKWSNASPEQKAQLVRSLVGPLVTKLELLPSTSPEHFQDEPGTLPGRYPAEKAVAVLTDPIAFREQAAPNTPDEAKGSERQLGFEVLNTKSEGDKTGNPSISVTLPGHDGPLQVNPKVQIMHLGQPMDVYVRVPVDPTGIPSTGSKFELVDHHGKRLGSMTVEKTVISPEDQEFLIDSYLATGDEPLTTRRNDDLHVEWIGSSVRNGEYKGIGTALMEFAERLAHAADCPRIQTDASWDSHIFYYKLGFRALTGTGGMTADEVNNALAQAASSSISTRDLGGISMGRVLE